MSSSYNHSWFYVFSDFAENSSWHTAVPLFLRCIACCRTLSRYRTSDMK